MTQENKPKIKGLIEAPKRNEKTALNLDDLNCEEGELKPGRIKSGFFYKGKFYELGTLECNLILKQESKKEENKGTILGLMGDPEDNSTQN